MAVNAQTIASRCDPEDAHGRNYYYNISAVPGRLQDTLPIGQINTNYMLSILQVVLDDIAAACCFSVLLATFFCPSLFAFVFLFFLVVYCTLKYY